jgi:hypothetical protein
MIRWECTAARVGALNSCGHEECYVWDIASYSGVKSNRCFEVIYRIIFRVEDQAK